MDRPLVSVCCLTYNHERYIADAIESFLMQKTDFIIEIIIHDDASTDGTRAIIKEYEKEYPNIIYPIYQDKNQHSQKKGIMRTFVIPRVKGKYIATCEGDDFWIDPFKLQKQVNFLEGEPGYTMCFHKVKVVDIYKNDIGRYLGVKSKVSRSISIAEAANGGIVHVSSRLIKTEFYKKNKPIWLDSAKHGDYASALHMAAEGKVFYINECMSAYRSGVENSMMTNFRNNYTLENTIDYYLNRIETLDMADKYYNFRFHDDISRVNIGSKTIIALLKSEFTRASIKIYISFIREYGLMNFIKQVLLNKTPKFARFLVRLIAKTT